MSKLLCGDAREMLATLPENSIHCCVTSPPYYALRQYNGGEQEIGIETTPEAYIEHLLAVFREVKRVLHPSGTCWVVMGDSFAGSGCGWQKEDSSSIKRTWLNENRPGGDRSRPPRYVSSRQQSGLKPLDLMGIPWMLAFALRTDGWYWRQEIIWAKSSCMPESVQSRCTRSHEVILMLAKSPKYFYDAFAIRERCRQWGMRDRQHGKHTSGRPPISGGPHQGFQHGNYLSRNCRDTWTISPEYTKEQHYATFPTALVRRCILAGTSERGCCPDCGAPWIRQVQRTMRDPRSGQTKHCADHRQGKEPVPEKGWIVDLHTTGWNPSCGHGHDPVPCTVLDPFLGSGTSAVVALRLHRQYVGIDLNPDYLEMAMRRIQREKDTAPLLYIMGGEQ